MPIRKAAKTSTNLLNLSAQRRTDRACLEGIEVPSRHAVPRALSPLIPGIPSRVKKDWNSNQHVDYYWAAVSPAQIRVASAWNRTSCYSGSPFLRQFKHNGTNERHWAGIYQTSTRNWNGSLIVTCFFCKTASTLLANNLFCTMLSLVSSMPWF